MTQKTMVMVRNDVSKIGYRVVTTKGIDVMHPGVGVGVYLKPSATILQKEHLTTLEDAGYKVVIDNATGFYKEKKVVEQKATNPNMRLC